MIEKPHFKETQNIYQNIGIVISVILFALVLGNDNAASFYVNSVRYLDIPSLLLFSPETMGFVFLLLFLLILAIPATYFHLWVVDKRTHR